MNSASLPFQDCGDYLLVTLRNPGRRNALTPAMYDALRAALVAAARLHRIGAVVITGADGYFCAGGDLNALVQRAALSETERRARIEDLHDTIRAIHACPRPVIAAIEGGAAGAGLSIALACDVVIAAKDAVFSAAYVRAGLVPDGGLTAALARAMPPAMAARLCLTGDPVGAARLADWGIVTDLMPPGGTMSRAAELATSFAAGPAAAQAAIKQLLAQSRDTDINTQMDAERDAMARALGSPEAAVGIAARLARRTPDFGRTAGKGNVA